MSQPLITNQRQLLWISLSITLAIVAAVLTSVFLTKSMLQSAVAAGSVLPSTTTSSSVPYSSGQTASSVLSCPAPTQTNTNVTGDQLGVGGMGGGQTNTNQTSLTKLIRVEPASMTRILNNYITNSTEQINTAYYNSNNVIGSYNTATYIKNNSKTITDSFNKTSTKTVVNNSKKLSIHNNYHYSKKINYHPKSDVKVNYHPKSDSHNNYHNKSSSSKTSSHKHK